MKTSTSPPWKRWALLALIGSIGISALVGVGVLLVGNFGATEEKILATTGTLAMFSLCALVGGTFFEARGKKGVSLAGLGTTWAGGWPKLEAGLE